MLSRCFLDCSVGVGVFVTGLSQISSFFYCVGLLHHPFWLQLVLALFGHYFSTF